MSKYTLKAIMAASVLLVGANAASAGTDAVRAEAFFNAISGGNSETVSSFYADKAEFHWVGGPLAGIYKGKAQIKGVWEKFGSAAGKLTYKTIELSESNNGPVSTVTARVNFIGPKEVPVKFILMFKDGKIVNQIWQVDRGESYTAAKAPAKAPAPAVPARAERPDAPDAEPQQGAPAQDDPSEVAAVDEGADGAPAPEAGNDPQADESKAPPPAPTPNQAAPEAPTPPPGLAGPGEGAPAKKIVKKAEKKAKRDYGYGYDDDGYDQGYWAPRGHHHRRRFHGGYGHGHGGY